MKVAALAIAILGALPASGCEDSSQLVWDREAVLKGIANDVVRPNYQAVAARAGELEAAVVALCDAPADAAKLEGAKTAWIAVSTAWERSEAHEGGPVETGRYKGAIDFWPVRPETIEQAIAGATTYDDAYIDAQGSPAKGLPAMEYLLFGPGDAAADAQRCAYLEALGRDVTQQATALAAAWEPDGGDFTAELLLDPKLGIDMLVNELVEGTETMASMKLGVPLGSKTGGTPQPEAVEAPYVKRSVQNLRENMAGIAAVWGLERSGETLASVIERASPGLDALIREQFDTIAQSLDAIEQPLAEAVVDAPAAVEEARAAIKRLHTLIAVDAAILLGVTITFTDNDGD